MIQTDRKNFDNFAGEDIEKTNLYRNMQSMVANPPDDISKKFLLVRVLQISRLKSKTYLTHMPLLVPISTG